MVEMCIRDIVEAIDEFNDFETIEVGSVRMILGGW